jgi:hypothetical protein
MKLLDFARSHDAEILHPIGEERIAAFEEERDLILPAGLREFYTEAGGTKEFTECSWRIWPFDELVTLDQKLRTQPDIEFLNGHTVCPDLCDYLAFIEALIEAPLYAVCANPKNPRYGEVISLAGDSNPFLAGPIESLEEFLLILSAKTPTRSITSREDNIKLTSPHPTRLLTKEQLFERNI